MREIGIVVGIIVTLLLAQLAVRLYVSPSWLMLGFWLISLGLIVSVPAAIAYHVQLYRALAPQGALDRGWIWRPTAHHDRLRKHERRGVLVWFVFGVFGWSVALLGCALVAATIMLN